MKNFITRALVAKKHLKLFFALFAMLALGVGNAWGAWEKATSIAAGDVVLLVCETKSMELSSITTYGVGVAYTTTPTGVYELTIEEGASTGTVSFKNGSTYLNWSSKNTLSTSDTKNANSSWTVTFEEGNAIISNVSDNTRKLQWNAGSPRFACYTSDQTAVQLYKKVSSSGGGETPDPTPDPEDPTPETGSSTGWVETAIGNITSSDIVVVTMTNSNGTYAMSNNNGTSKAPTATEVEVSDGKLTKEPTDEYKWNISNTSGTLIFYPNGSTSTWLYCTATNNGVRVGTNTASAFTIDAESGYLKHTGTTRYLGVYSSQDWRCYTSATATNIANQTLKFYKYVEPSSGGGDPEPVIVKTLKSIAVTGMTTNFEIGETFTFDGTCTATYSVTKDSVAQTDETAEVTPTSVSEPDMSTAGTKEVTVTYTEGEITKTFLYNITVENALPKIVITQNEVAEFTNTYAEYTWTASGVSGKIYGYKNSGMQLNSSKDGSYVYNTDPIPGYIRKIKIVKAASGTTRNWTPYVSETALTSAEGTVLTQKEVATTTTWEVTGENSYFYLLESGGATVIELITIYYEAVVPQVAAPTFTPAAGTYNAVQNVTISAEAGTTIYYTLDGTDPTTTSNVYASAIEISETTTVKAIAVKDEKVSPIASAKYTINLPLTTMDQIFTKATAVGSTATSVEITFGNWVVSAVKEDGKTAFVTDGTKGFVIFDKDVNLGFSVGNILSGTATCKVQLYNGFAELTELKSTTVGLSVGSGGTITTQELDAADIAALTGVNTGSLIKINGTCTSESSKYYVADVQIYTSLYDFGTLEVGAEYNITGIYQPYNKTKEMLPRSAADIEKVVGLPTATIAIANITMEVGEEKDIEATITPAAAQSTVQYAITSGNEYITLSGTTITAVAAGTATITATIAEKADEYKGATKEFTVTVKPQNIAELPFEFTGGKADIENTLGMSQKGLGNDYSGTTNLRFDNTGDCVIIHFNGQAEKLAYDIKGNSFSDGTFSVQESADGETYTDVVAHTELGDAATKEHELAAESRYVKFIYTEKVNGNVGLGNIKITKPDPRQEASLVWNPSAVTLTQGDAFTAPTLNHPNSVSGITYETSNDEVATVTTAGVIALATGIGTATITATFAGDATYKPATATCTITVNEYIETIDGEWELVTDASKLQAGMEIIIASVADAGAVKTMGEQGNNNRSAVASTVDGDKLNPAVGTTVITLEDCQLYEGLFALKTKDGYLYAAGSSSNHLKSQEGINDNACWTITVTEGVAAVVATKSSNRNIMRYNENNDLFSCYASGQKDIALYAKVPEHSRSTSAGRYGTICLPGNIVKCLGATLYEVAGKDGLRVVFDEVLTPEAGMPYIFLAHNAEVLFFCGDQTAAEGNHNSLYGTFFVLQDAQLDGKYMVQNNKIVKCAATGCGVAEYRAYFNGGELEALGKPGAQMPGRRRITMGTESENTATGTEDVVAPAGQTLKIIENGQLIIIRNGEKFNAQGVRL